MRTKLRMTFCFRAASAVVVALAALPLWAQPAGDADIARRLGVIRPTGMTSAQVGQAAARMLAAGRSGIRVGTQSVGLPTISMGNAALSAAIATNVGYLGHIAEPTLMADWDGLEDNTADRASPIDDFSSIFAGGAQTLTRVALSEHTIANGFNENVYYYGDSVGNVYVGIGASGPDLVTQSLVINLPTVLNAFGNLNSDDQIVVTGLAVSPVCDLTSFSNVNGSFASFANLVGEILYVTYWDTSGGFRLMFNGQLIRSGVLAFPIADIPSAAKAPPGILSDTGFPIQVGGSFGVFFSTYANLAGCAVDDDGSVYTQQVDLLGMTGGNIVKITSLDQPRGYLPNPWQDRSLATSGFVTTATLNPTNGSYGTSSGPSFQVNTFTNYSGTSPTFGNIVALACGPGNVLYAAVARSYVATDDPATQATEGLFPSATALGPTPSMIISFADSAGPFGPVGTPQPDGYADIQLPGPLVVGVNNFRAFVLGDGPDPRSPSSGVFGSTATTQKVSFQVDYTIFSGLVVDEERSVYVVSGGTPAGIGRDPSPSLGEILKFPDIDPPDRRADYIDFRGDNPPNPPDSGGNVGNGVDDRFDHIFWQAPLDNNLPTGISGLARGFLLYLNRTRNNPTPLPSLDSNLALPNGKTQGDDDSTANPVYFEDFDPSHQVAGGDDQNPPFKGDDSDGGGSPTVAGPLAGGFEFLFGGTDTTCPTPVWNAFYLNSNGNITFGAGDNANIPDSGTLMTGSPRIAPAWTDLNSASSTRGGGVAATGFTNTFPVQALGFANINDFKIRWIDVPEFGYESLGHSNTFSLSLWDDGTGVDENANQPFNPANPIGNNAVPFDLKEGPTDLHWKTVNGTLVGQSPRPDGTGYFAFDYGYMDLITDSANTSYNALTGYSIGGLPATPVIPPVNLSTDGRGNVPIWAVPGAAVYELFTYPGFDLRFEGNSAPWSTPSGQTDSNLEHLNFFGATCGPLTPTALLVDAAGDGVLEPGESVVVTPSWKSTNGTVTLFSSAGNFTGPGSPPPYSIFDSTADYGSVGASAVDCASATGDCFGLSLAVPASRPSQHWDASFDETTSAGLVKHWKLHIGNSFTDVTSGMPFYKEIETLFHYGLTAGCGGGAYCPNMNIPRWQMAIMLTRVLVGAPPVIGSLPAPYDCSSGGNSLFTDVAPTDFDCPFIHYIYSQGITSGCVTGMFCPNDPVSRWQMSIFLTHALGVVPPTSGVVPVLGPYNCTGGGNSVFTDIDPTDFGCPYVHYLASQGVTTPCDLPTHFCPSAQLPRGDMAAFTTRGFGLQLYGP